MAATWSYTVHSRLVLPHLIAGSIEDAEIVMAHLVDMRMRGLNDPLHIASNGAPD